MKNFNLLSLAVCLTILLVCTGCPQKPPVYVFHTMKIYKQQIDQLYVCDTCNDPTDTCFKRLIFQFTDSILDQNQINFYLTGWIGFQRKDHVDPMPLPLELEQDSVEILEPPFTFANVDWTKGEIRRFLKEVSEDKKCEDASYSYITLSAYIDNSQGKPYLSLIVTSYDSKGNKIFSASLSDKSTNPRPPYPPQG